MSATMPSSTDMMFEEDKTTLSGEPNANQNVSKSQDWSVGSQAKLYQVESIEHQKQQYMMISEKKPYPETPKHPTKI